MVQSEGRGSNGVYDLELVLCGVRIVGIILVLKGDHAEISRVLDVLPAPFTNCDHI